MAKDGIKSKQFGCYWKTMFLTAMGYPEDIKKCKNPIETKKRYKEFYNSFQYVLPCKFCRDYIKNVLNIYFPLDYTGREQLFESIYIWKDAVNKKLYEQGVSFKKSPPLKVVKSKYNNYRATSCSTGKTCI